MPVYLLVFLCFGIRIPEAAAQIALAASASPPERYAAAELQRYYYQLSGRFLSVGYGEKAVRQAEFVLAAWNDPLLASWKNRGAFGPGQAPGPQGYMIRTFDTEKRQTVVIAGADSTGVLYGVYGLLEDHLGMRFYFSGDVYPERNIRGALPVIREVRTPLTAIRGFLPWTNFPQSATVYSWDDWRCVIDRTAKMRMNFILVHNYNGFGGHNEMFHNFEYDGFLSRGWMPTVKTGHGWGCPGWEIGEYLFGASDLYDDYDFGADYALHNETLTNSQIREKGEVAFRQVIAYAHSRGVKIGLGLDIDVVLPEYGVEPDDPRVIRAQAEAIAGAYLELDYLFCFQSEGKKEAAFYDRWQTIFNGFYKEMKRLSPGTRLAASGWGLTPGSVERLPEDVICAPISYYSAAFEPGGAYGDREYWGCPWLERDFDSSEYYYPYHMDLSETIRSFENASANMNGFFALTWRLADAVSPKMWYVGKAPWYGRGVLDTSEKVYRDFARACYGERSEEAITRIIDRNEPYATNFGECQETPGFRPAADAGMLLNFRSLDFSSSNHRPALRIEAADFTEKHGCGEAPCEEGGVCMGYVRDGDWLKYGPIDWGADPERLSVRVASASAGGEIAIHADRLDGPVVARFEVKNTGGWQSWRTLTVPVSGWKGVHALYVRFGAFDAVARAGELAGAQLGTIDSCLALTTDAGQRLRLLRLRARIQGAACHIDLNAGFEKYVWEDLPGSMEPWARSFLYRIEDISSYGNIMSTQNRFVQQNYVAKADRLRKRQRVQAPSHVTARGTPDGAQISWRNAEPAAAGFTVCRNGAEVASVPAGTTCYRDTFEGAASYTVYARDVEGRTSLCGIPARCLAGSADRDVPLIVFPSPLVSIRKGCPLDIRFSVIENRAPEFVSAVLYYRKPGTRRWKKRPFERRVRSVFALRLPASEIGREGIEYYISVSDSLHTARFPVSAPLRNHTVVVTETPPDAIPAAPAVACNRRGRFSWNRIEGAAMYRIYRSRLPDFEVGPASFVTFVGAGTVSFADNGFGFDGTSLAGVYYYRLVAVSPGGRESAASEPLRMDYR